MKQALFILIVTLFCQLVFAQTKTSVAIFPFVSGVASYKNRAAQIQQIVIELLRKKSDIEVIDRSNDSLLIKELDLQIREYSMASGKLAQQGKVLGAKQMIVGNVSNLKVDKATNKSSGINFLTKKQVNNVSTEYTAYISFALQLSDVETGQIINQKSFTNADVKTKILSFANVGTASTEEDAVLNAINSTKVLIAAWINECFPPLIKILKIEDRDKKGFPETILVTGIDASLTTGAKLALNELEILDAGGGKKLTRSKKIAELKITQKQGDITVCKITDGEKIIEEKINAHVKLEIGVK